MIISHKHKFIFIKTEKTAGTSIEIALSKYCGPDDIITPISPKDEVTRKELGYRGPQNYLVPFSKYSARDWASLIYHRQRRAFYNHISAQEIKQYISNDVWNSYYKFCFERNPFDKLVSLYYWIGSKYPTIYDFMMSGKASYVKGFVLWTINAIPVVDHIYKFEEMHEAFKHISAVLKLDPEMVIPEKKAKSNFRKDKRHYREILTEQEKQWVYKIFAREFAYLDYKF